MLRKAKFSGPTSFYSDNSTFLDRFFEANTTPDIQKKPVYSVICPHAGYIFSAKTALKTLDLVLIPDTVVLIGPNHTGYGPPLSIMMDGTWEIPGAAIAVNQKVATSLIKNSKLLANDTSAHLYEHSIEVILPMVHYFNKNISIVPIIMGSYEKIYWEDLAKALFYVSLSEQSNFLVIASSDMSHFENRKEAIRKDEMAFEKIRSLDSNGLMEVVTEENISMCGSGPVAVSMAYSKRKGANHAQLIDYTDSGYATGDLSRVVSYAGFIVE
jgi:AmmeMemoRadiSam system protein B